jgi:hypothetical protein
MSKIARPNTKEGGFRQYTDKVAAGFNAIIDQEVDDDFNTIYNDYAGNIDDNNIPPSQHSSTGGLNADRDLTPGSITSRLLSTGLVLPGGQIAPGSITIAQLAPGAVINQMMFSSGAGVTLAPDTVTPLLTLPINIRATNSTTVALGVAAGTLPMPPFPEYPNGGGVYLTVDLVNPDGSYNPSQLVSFQGVGEQHAGTAAPTPIACSKAPWGLTVLGSFWNVPAAGNYTVTLAAEVDLSGFNTHAFCGSFQLLLVSFA